MFGCKCARMLKSIVDVLLATSSFVKKYAILVLTVFWTLFLSFNNICSAEVGVIKFNDSSLSQEGCQIFLDDVKKLFDDSFKIPIHVDTKFWNEETRDNLKVRGDRVLDLDGKPTKFSIEDFNEIHRLLLVRGSDDEEGELPLYRYALEPYQKLIEEFIEEYGRNSILCLESFQKLLPNEMNKSTESFGHEDMDSGIELMSDLQKLEPGDKRIDLIKSEIEKKRGKSFYYTFSSGLHIDKLMALYAYLETSLNLLEKTEECEIDMSLEASKLAFPVFADPYGISSVDGDESAGIHPDFRPYFQNEDDPQSFSKILFIDKHFDVERQGDGSPKLNLKGDVVSLKILVTSNVEKAQRQFQNDVSKFCKGQINKNLCFYSKRLEKAQLRDTPYVAFDIGTDDTGSNYKNETVELLPYNRKSISSKSEFFISFKLKPTPKTFDKADGKLANVRIVELPHYIQISPQLFNGWNSLTRIIDLYGVENNFVLGEDSLVSYK